MDLKVCNGLYVRPYKYYPTREAGAHEMRYQVIYDGSDDGNKHIMSSLGSGFKSEEAAIEYCNSLMREPQWRHGLEVRIVSELLLGYTVRYQLDHFDEIFSNRGWSEYEKGLAHKILTGQLDNQCVHEAPTSKIAESLDTVIRSCEKVSKDDGAKGFSRNEFNRGER